MTISLKDIRLIEQTRYPTPTKLTIGEPPLRVPTNIAVTGQQGFIRVQWVVVLGVDGYDVAVMTSPNLAAPDVNIAKVMGDKNREYAYPCGNVALTRYFAVRTFNAGFFSDWTAIASGVSIVYAGAEAAPPPSPSAPSSIEPPPSGYQGPKKVSSL